MTQALTSNAALSRLRNFLYSPRPFFVLDMTQREGPFSLWLNVAALLGIFCGISCETYVTDRAFCAVLLLPLRHFPSARVTFPVENRVLSRLSWMEDQIARWFFFFKQHEKVFHASMP